MRIIVDKLPKKPEKCPFRKINKDTWRIDKDGKVIPDYFCNFEASSKLKNCVLYKNEKCTHLISLHELKNF